MARNPRDIDALIEAGDSATAMGDPEAAAGFYKRADAISANNPRVQAGLARALVLQGDPMAALPLFASAEARGAADDVTADHGLAYDLVGDQAAAQKYYRVALARKDDDELRRRYGVSLAIAGDAAASEAMLMPLLRKQDKPGWRSHAFALAIAGKTKEAVETVNAILPTQLAESMTPYLRYMPRLTRAQQAAAANLGKFPRAAEIGRDDPAIAAYVPRTSTRVAAADAGLIPKGKPMGSGTTAPANATAKQKAAEPLSRAQVRAKERAAKLARAEADAAARVAPPEPMPAIDRSESDELPPVGGARNPAKPGAGTSAANARPAAPESSSSRLPANAQRQTSTSAVAANLSKPAPGGLEPVRATAAVVPDRSVPAASPANTLATQSAAPAPGFDLARVGTATANTPRASGGSAPGSVTLEQIFADLGAPSRAPAPVAGAVDVLAIEPAKPEPPAQAVVDAVPAKPSASKADESKVAEADKGTQKKSGSGKAPEAKDEKRSAASTKKGTGKKAESKKEAPSHPSRIWVQIGVGRDEKAIAFDWGRLSKQHSALFKGRKANVSDMGRTNRILVGPFETQKEAGEFAAQVKKADISNAFVWTSPAGQVVDQLAKD
ncbi:SPOR domain-containing protein [Novosphingobium sp. M1R2S20]|uniref:SPOR domain-containing protein n=1 Tax=Novosphingobium rhizovicinum TaxID=3228928 RepID=A0ABV3R9T4_9SPHN